MIDWIKHNKEWLFSGLGISAISTMIIAFKHLYHKSQKKEQHSEATLLHDNSSFVSENPPDGITIPVGKVFNKSWTIKNSGDIVWENRVLRCTEYVSKCFYPVKMEIPIPKTYPNQIITIHVKYYVYVEGDYSSKWKMYDKNNNLLYPQKRIGLGVNIKARHI